MAAWPILADMTRWVGSLMLIALSLPVPVGGRNVGTMTAKTPTLAWTPQTLRSGPKEAINSFRMKDDVPEVGPEPAMRLSGTQSLVRALDILDAIAERPMLLAELAAHVGLSSTTCYRLASALVARGLLSAAGRSGYRLGDRIAELAIALSDQRCASDRT